jgi:hypothetical protein
MHRKLKLEAAARHVQKTFEATQGSISYAQALNLLSELEGFKGYRQVRALLGEEVLKSEPPPGEDAQRQFGAKGRKRKYVSVTLMDGTKDDWDFTNNISDRDGDLNDYDWENKVDGHVLETDAALLEQLQDQMVEGDTFIASKDGKLGILIEIEYVCLESDGDRDDLDDEDLVLYEDRVAQILRGHRPLCAQYPRVQFCVPEECEVANDRPAIWAFFENGVLTRKERKALHEAMSDIAFGRAV